MEVQQKNCSCRSQGKDVTISTTLLVWPSPPTLCRLHPAPSNAERFLTPHHAQLHSARSTVANNTVSTAKKTVHSAKFSEKLRMSEGNAAHLATVVHLQRTAHSIRKGLQLAFNRQSNSWPQLPGGGPSNSP